MSSSMRYARAAAALAAMAVFLAGCGAPAAGTVHPPAGTDPPLATASPRQATAAPAQSPEQTPAPPEPFPLTGLKSLAAGPGYSLAVDGDGRVLAWGKYDAAVLGGAAYASEPEKIQVIDTGAVSVAAGKDYCAQIKSDGSLWVWGCNKDVCGASGIPSPKKMLDNVASVALGGSFMLAVQADGTLCAWGSNEYGQLADGRKAKRLDSPAPVMQGVKKAAAGDEFSLILLADGTLLGCGYNEYGQLLGKYTKKVSLYPGTERNVKLQTAPVKLMDGVADVSAGGSHGVVLDMQGCVWAFGGNYYGQVGDGWSANTAVEYRIFAITAACEKPVKVLDGAAAITAAGDVSGALKNDGSLWLWGGNANNQLGNGGFQDAYAPQRVLGGVRLVAQGTRHGMAVRTDGSLWCWGDNRYGELGFGYGNYLLDYRKVADDVRQVCTNGKTTLIVKNDGSLHGFGCNDSGQLAGASETSVSAPILLMRDISQADLGDSAAYCVKTDGSLWSWGQNNFGALGNGVLEDGKFQLTQEMKGTNSDRTTKMPKAYRDRILKPRSIRAPAKILDRIRQVFAYSDCALAVGADGTLWGWGMNESGAYSPDGSPGNTAKPTKRLDGVDGMPGMFMLNKADGSLHAWGRAAAGDIRRKPVRTPLSSAVSAISSATWYMAATADGALWAWGRFGEREVKKPVKVEDHVKKVAMGEQMLVVTDVNVLYSVSSVSFERWMEAGGGPSGATLLTGDTARKELEGVADAVPADWRIRSLEGYSLSVLALKTDGTLWACGFSQYGQLGDGNVTFVPTQVSK